MKIIRKHLKHLDTFKSKIYSIEIFTNDERTHGIIVKQITKLLNE